MGTCKATFVGHIKRTVAELIGVVKFSGVWYCSVTRGK